LNMNEYCTNPLTCNEPDVVKNLNDDISFNKFNVAGLIVKRGQLGSAQTIPTSDLKDGVYCIILRDSKGNIMETRKLVKLK